MRPSFGPRNGKAQHVWATHSLFTFEYVDLDLRRGRVVGHALVDAGVSAVGALHQEVDAGLGGLLSDHLDKKRRFSTVK